MAEEEDQNLVSSLSPSFPLSKIKRIIKLDRDIKKTTSEATLLISLATDLFIASLADGARTAVLNAKRRVIRSDDVRSAVKSHGPTADFLLDCLSVTAPRSEPLHQTSKDKEHVDTEEEITLPRGTRRIDQIFHKVPVVVDSDIGIDSGVIN